MTNSNYPALLNRRARIFASLNRVELMTLAITYLFLSAIKVGGIKAILINLVVLVVMKVLNSKMPKGFLKNFRSKSTLDWSGKLGEINE
jgi:hypothetical protein